MSYFLFEQIADGSWRLVTLVLAPDAGTACDYYLGELRSKPGQANRIVRTLAVAPDPLGCPFGRSIPASASDEFTFFYRGW